MKKIISLFFIASILLSACGANQTETAIAKTPTAQSGAAGSTPGPTPEAASRLEVHEEALNGLEVTVWMPWYGLESSLFETFAEEFNSSNPWGIRVAAQSQINFTNLYETVTASLAKTDQPDLVIALPEHAQEWHAEGVVTDLTDYVKDPVYGLDAKDIPFAFWNQDVSMNARVGVPAQRTATVLLWNQTWADELGFGSAPVSPDDFKQQACRAQDSMRRDEFAENDAMGGWLVSTEPMTAYSWMLAFGGGVLEEGNYRFLAPKNIDAFKFLRELSEAGCAWQGASDAIASFANREALFVTVDLGDLPGVTRAFAGANNRDEWAVLPFPNNGSGIIAVYGSSYVILNSSEEEQLAAWLFVKWLLEKEQDARWVEATHLFPLRSSTLELLGDYEKTHPHWKQAVDLIPQGEMQPQLGSWRTVKVMLGDGFAHMYRVNVASGQVAAILAQMETMAKDLSK
ncbi:MAG: hypothetical protein DPW18_03715 [Chloroflexi bacterium]|nr:hypothetical protein [Chloroflexota bacterium]MDL1941952.1 extracellular solute-binding protein [Chloroflexi bacterium CFX2]